jgi:hypothetical protein
MAQCDGCDDEAVTELKGCLLCEACVVTFNQWSSVQASRERVEAKRLKRCREYVDGLTVAERGSSSGQLLNAVMDAMELQERLNNHERAMRTPIGG